MTQQRLAAIDVCSNTIRSITDDVDQKTGFCVLDDVKSTAHLGEGLSGPARKL